MRESVRGIIFFFPNLAFLDNKSEALLIYLDKEGICASSGSACLADSDAPSHVIKAMEAETNASRQMIRFSLDVMNSPTEVHSAVATLQISVTARSG